MADRSGTQFGSSQRSSSIQTLCALLICGVACFRTVVGFDPFPWWSSDPFESYADSTGLTPALALWLDAAALVGSSIGMGAFVLAGGRPHRWLCALTLVGAVGAIAWLLGEPLDSARLAFAWLSAITSACALAHLCGDPRRKALALALLLGAAGLLAAKGLVQVLVEHPDTVAWYERDPQAFLRAQGWEPGSAQALGYERRLRQPEATGWFGLSNVYATSVGAASIAMLAMLAVAIRDRLASARNPEDAERGRPGPVVALAAGTVAAVTGLLLSGSKGGMVAAAGGASAFALVGLLASRIRRPQPWAAMTAVGLTAAPLIAVAARGLLGERISELSLRFRWFYMQGATRIIGEHPLVGVGPAGFRDAYMLVKPPLAVEDVTSPHSLPFDLLSSFGVIPGAGWYAATALLGVAATASWWTAARPIPAGTAAPGPTIVDPIHPPRQGDFKLVALLAILATVPATYLERSLATPETAILRIAGLGLWVLIAWGVLGVARTAPRALAAGGMAAAAVLLLHSGIEMTPGWIGAQTWFFCLLAVAAGRLGQGQPHGQPSPAGTRMALRSAILWVVAVLLCGFGGLAIAPWRLLAWERSLHQAWSLASRVGRIRDELRVLDADPALAAELRVTPQAVRAEVAEFLGTPPAATPQEFERQLNQLLRQSALGAESQLARAPVSAGIQTVRAADRASQRLAESYLGEGDIDAASQVIGNAIARTQRAAQAADSALGWSHLGSLWALRATIEDRAGRPEQARASRSAAMDAYATAMARDPDGVYHPVRLARLAVANADRAMAARAARAALANDQNARLDPLMGLSDAERAEMRALAGQ